MVAFGQNVVEIVIRARDRFSKTFSKARLSMESFRKSALGMAAVGTVIAIGFAKAIKTSIDFESAFTGVRKTVELSEKGFAELEQRFKTLSTETGTTFIELSRIGELAGQLGVSGVENLSKFTRVIADIAVTTNLTAEEAATSFARIANVMQEPLENIDRMGATVVDLGNNFATTEAEIATFGQRISGAGKIVGFTTADVFAIGTALSSVGVQAEAGGTAVQMGLLKINAAVIDGGSKLRIFAKTAGLTSEEFAEMWETDASGAFEKFILGLGTQGDKAQTTLKAVGLGSVRATRAFLSLSNAGDLITRALKTSEEAWEANSALTDEAQKRYATLERQLAKAKAEFAILGDEIGDVLAPILKSLIPIIIKVIDFIKGLPGPLKTAIIVLGLVTVAVTLLAGAIALATLVASPWLVIIGAIILAITAVILAIIFWKQILITLVEAVLKAAAWMDKAWQLIKDGFVVAFEIMKNVAFKVWNSIVDFIGRKIQKVIDFINTLIRAANAAGASLSFVPNVDLSGIKGQITDIPALQTQLNLESQTRARQFGQVVNQTIINIENNIGLDPDDVAESLQTKMKNITPI